jgi:hypothetical protein
MPQYQPCPTWQGQPGQLLHEGHEAPLAPQARSQGLGLWVVPHPSTELHARRYALLQQQLTGRDDGLWGRPLVQLDRLQTITVLVRTHAHAQTFKKCLRQRLHCRPAGRQAGRDRFCRWLPAALCSLWHAHCQNPMHRGMPARLMSCAALAGPQHHACAPTPPPTTYLNRKLVCCSHLGD